MSIRSLDSLTPTESLEIENGLSLVPRIKLNLTVHPALPSSATKPIDEWKLKRALTDFLKTSLSVPITVPESDLDIKRFKDLKNRKRDDPLAHGTLCIRDLGFLTNSKKRGYEEDDAEKKFLDWRKYVVEKMDGIELNLQGDKYKLSVSMPDSDDFESMKKALEEFHAFGNRGNSREMRREVDTIVIRGVPSRWFAEPRVSSKPSMLVTHTIFSTFGKIRNLSIAEDDDRGTGLGDDGLHIIPSLHCKIVVQFEKHRDFYNALKALSGRSLQKHGSQLKADYDVTWAKDSFFRDSRSQAEENSRSRMPVSAGWRYRNEAPREDVRISRFTSDDTRRKKFKE